LDRDLLEFVYAIPQEQLVRLGRRRSLMRRALVDIVPEEILNRKKQKVDPQRLQKQAITGCSIRRGGCNLISSSLGIVDREHFLEALDDVQSNDEALVRSLMLTIKLEAWLHHLASYGVLTQSVVENGREGPSPIRGRATEKVRLADR